MYICPNVSTGSTPTRTCGTRVGHTGNFAQINLIDFITQYNAYSFRNCRINYLIVPVGLGNGDEKFVSLGSGILILSGV